ncbi:YHS domain-containing protein [Mycobacterium barrassiae]|nr:YHS domain-containing protein [Mycobacterium barrassiae]UUO02055.1 YHS domain-containing protein [Mycolicibacterium novocastrense]
MMLSAAANFEHADLEAAVVFVDMSGFTAFTETHGDHSAAQLAETFAASATRVLGPADEVIKTIGDAVLVVCENPATAVTFLRRLTAEIRRVQGFPMLRAGIAAGPVVKRRGDVFGSTVNTAARLASLAQAGQIVVNDGVASALPAADIAAMTALGSLTLRNVGSPIGAFALDIGTHHREHVDPVCRMHVATGVRELTITHAGTSYRFCSTACMQQFAQRIDGDTT